MVMTRRVWTRQPQGAVGVDWSNPITRGLIFAAYGGFPEILSGVLPVPFGAVSRLVNSQGRSLNGTAETSGWYYPLPSSHRLYSITTEISAIIVGNITPSSQSPLLSIPVANGTWNSPFASFIVEPQSTNVTRILFSYSAAAYSYSDIGDNSVSAGTHIWSATRSGANLAIYTDGILKGSVSDVNSGNIYWGTKEPVCLLNESNSLPRSGATGGISLSLIFNRALSAFDIRLISVNPWQLFAPLSRPVFAPLSAGSGNLYWIIQDAAVPDPSGLQVCTGLDGNGNPAFKTGIEPCPSQGSGTTVVTELSQVLGMTGGIGYELFWAWSDA